METMKWDTPAQIECFDELWKRKGQHCRVDDWNTRADDWDRELRSDPRHAGYNRTRVETTAAFLRAHGLLAPDQEVLDIGCGTGRFAAEFARTAGHVTATDLSERMVHHGQAYAREVGAENLEFQVCDFTNADLDRLGWRGRFDLVFSSLSPAVSCLEDLRRMESVSRGYCCYQTFACTREPVARRILEEVAPGAVKLSHKDGRSYYAAFNLLWLSGRFPLTTQYCERREERFPADRRLAAKILRQLPEEARNEDVAEQISQRLLARADGDGLVAYPSEYWYGILLWDTCQSEQRGY